MTNAEIDSLLAAVATGAGSPRSAVEQLTAAGHTPADAEEWVFTALGGSDIVETNDDGVEVYHPSGRPVAEVLREMER